MKELSSEQLLAGKPKAKKPRELQEWLEFKPSDLGRTVEDVTVKDDTAKGDDIDANSGVEDIDAKAEDQSQTFADWDVDNEAALQVIDNWASLPPVEDGKANNETTFTETDQTREEWNVANNITEGEAAEEDGIEDAVSGREARGRTNGLVGRI